MDGMHRAKKIKEKRLEEQKRISPIIKKLKTIFDYEMLRQKKNGMVLSDFFGDDEYLPQTFFDLCAIYEKYKNDGFFQALSDIYGNEYLTYKKITKTKKDEIVTLNKEVGGRKRTDMNTEYIRVLGLEPLLRRLGINYDIFDEILSVIKLNSAVKQYSTLGNIFFLLKKNYDLLGKRDWSLLFDRVDDCYISTPGKHLEIEGDLYKLSDLKIWISDKIKKVKYEEYQQDKNQINIEINADRQYVGRQIKNFGLDSKYNKFLDNLKKSSTKELSEEDVAGKVGNLREFFHNVIIDLADYLSTEVDDKIPDYKDDKGKKYRPIAKARRYLKEKLLLSKKDDKFIDSYVNLLHKNGGHTFSTKKEYFRLTVNIGVEILYLIIDKLDKEVIEFNEKNL